MVIFLNYSFFLQGRFVNKIVNMPKIQKLQFFNLPLIGLQNHKVIKMSEAHIYSRFTEQISKLVNNPSKQLQQRLIEYPIVYYVEAIHDDNQSLDMRKMCCMLLKLKISVRSNLSLNQANSLLSKLQTIYMLNPNDKQLYRLQNAIQMIMQKIFQTYFDDMAKMKLFENIMKQIVQEPLYKQARQISFLNMLIRKMHYLTINNQIFIGEIVVYIDQVFKYYEQNIASKSQHQQNINTKQHIINKHQQNINTKQHIINKHQQNINTNERIINKDQQNINTNQRGQHQLKQLQDQVIEVLIKSIEVIRQIKDIIQTEIEDDNEDQVTQFMVGSSLMAKSFMKMFRMQPLNQQNVSSQAILPIWTNHLCLNKLKSKSLQIWCQVHLYHSQPALLQLLLASILLIPKCLVIDQCQLIISSCLLLLQRSCLRKEYNEIFFKMTQNLTIKLFQLCSITQAEYQMIQIDPHYFVQIQDDFCKLQEMETLKTRAGSLISNLTLAIDGYLTFVVHLALLALTQLDRNGEKPEAQVKLWANFLSIWTCSQQQFIETSILMLSCLSDQIGKRKDLLQAVLTHLKRMMPYFMDISNPISKKPLFILRYMQLYSFISSPECLDHFIKNFTNEVVYRKCLQKSYQTLMHYYCRQDPLMQQYIVQIGNSILLLQNSLSPLLQQQIMNNNKIIKRFKQKVLEKLVLWFGKAYQDQDVIRVNKLSTLIIRLLHDNLRTQLQQTKQDMYSTFDKQFINQYLQQIYQLLYHLKQNCCQQAIVQIAISHVQYLYDMQQMDIILANEFYKIAKHVIQKNNLSLNNSLILLNSIICPGVQSNNFKNYKSFKYDDLTFIMSIQLLKQITSWLQLKFNNNQSTNTSIINKNDQNNREQDLWEIYQIVEICLFQINVRNSSNKQITINVKQQVQSTLNFILKYTLLISQKCSSSVMRSKIMLIILQIVSLIPGQYDFLPQLNLATTNQVPAYECRKYCYYLLKILQIYQCLLPINFRIHLLQTTINLLYYLQNLKYHCQNYSQKIILTGDSISLNAYHKSIKIYSPFQSRIYTNQNDMFRQIIRSYVCKEDLLHIDSLKEFHGKIRDLCDKITVNHKVRKIMHVKRN